MLRDWQVYQIVQVIKWKIQVSFSKKWHLQFITQIRQQISQKKNKTFFLCFYKTHGMQQYW